MDKIVELTNVFLELLRLGEVVQPLGKSVSIFIAYYLAKLHRLLWDFSVKGFNVFADSLMSTTIQDGSKRERSNIHISHYCLFLFSIL